MAVTGRPTYGQWVRPRSPGIGPLGLIGSALLLGGVLICVQLRLPEPLRHKGPASRCRLLLFLRMQGHLPQLDPTTYPQYARPAWAHSAVMVHLPFSAR